MSEQGRFIWYDLYTSDVEAASRFYSAVVGWTIKDSGMPGPDKYLLLHAPGAEGGVGVGGMMGPRGDMAGVTPFWGGYLYTKNVDEAAARLQKLGGALHRGPMEIPQVGRFAVVADPQGGAFYLFAPTGEGALKDKAEPGYIGWRELRSTDDKAAFAFYSELGGWSKDNSFDMGPHGTYTLWKTQDGQRGGIMRGERTEWRYVFNVESVDAAVAAAKREGGEVTMEAHREPEGGWVAHFKDPQGAMFGVCGKK